MALCCLQNGCCRRADACPFAHGIFECWMHPSRYRTQVRTTQSAPRARAASCLSGQRLHCCPTVSSWLLQQVVLPDCLQMCSEVLECKRRVCFFAHTEDELRKPIDDSTWMNQHPGNALDTDLGTQTCTDRSRQTNSVVLGLYAAVRLLTI